MTFDSNISLNTVLTLTGVGAWAWDFEGPLYFDSQTREWLGIALDQPVQSVEDFLLLVEEAYHMPLLDAFEAIQLGQTAAFDQTIVLDEGVQGSGRHLRLQALAISTGTGLGLEGICESVKAPAGASQAPQVSCAGFERFLDLSSDLFAEACMDGYLQNLNPAWERVLGYSREELMARPFLDFVHPDDVSKTRRLLAQIADDTSAAEGERPSSAGDNFENRYRCKDGSYRYLSWSWAIEPEENRITGVARDVTTDKANDRQLAGTLAQLKDSNAQLQNFASVASHDMREPLRMISSYLRLLEERYPEVLDEKGTRYIRHACDGADRMRQLIEDLLTYARIGTDNKAFKEVPLSQVVEDAINNLSVFIESSHAEVSVDVGSEPVVLGDRIRLTRLLQNLLSNAIKFHGTEGPRLVHVACADGAASGEPDHWILSIRDNGIGIDSDHKDLLFNLFQRLNTRDEYEGSGIGLAVCRRIAEQHRGRIWFESEVGAGSTFFVSLRKPGADSI